MAQLFLLAILLVAIANFAIGSFLPPTAYKKVHAYVGYRGVISTPKTGTVVLVIDSVFLVQSIF